MEANDRFGLVTSVAGRTENLKIAYLFKNLESLTISGFSKLFVQL